MAAVSSTSVTSVSTAVLVHRFPAANSASASLEPTASSRRLLSATVLLVTGSTKTARHSMGDVQSALTVATVTAKTRASVCTLMTKMATHCVLVLGSLLGRDVIQPAPVATQKAQVGFFSSIMICLMILLLLLLFIIVIYGVSAWEHWLVNIAKYCLFVNVKQNFEHWMVSTDRNKGRREDCGLHKHKYGCIFISSYVLWYADRREWKGVAWQLSNLFEIDDSSQGRTCITEYY